MAQPSKRDKILQTAARLFMERGFNAVSVDQIAAAVPVSKPTLYAHFKDKRALFVAVINLRCQVFISALRAGLEGGRTPEESLYAFAREFIDMVLREESLRFKRVMIGESAAFPEMAKLFYESGPLKVETLLADYFAVINRKKLLKIPDPKLSADIFLSMIKGTAHLKCLLGITPVRSVTRANREQIARTVVQVFIRGHRP